LVGVADDCNGTTSTSISKAFTIWLSTRSRYNDLKPEGGTMTIKTETQYRHLEPRPGSNYRQFFLKGRRIRAAVVDEAIHGPDPFTPGEFAEEYQVPMEAVLEALDYVNQNRQLIERERDEKAARLHARGLDGPTQE
jgi:uncharacterized protein (DUF433 family)